MSSKSIPPINRKGLITVLYRKSDAPVLPLKPEDLASLSSNLNILDYECPFNTTLPLDEFLETGELLKHLDGLIGFEEAIQNPPRKISPHDLLIITRRNNSGGFHRAAFLLVDQFNPDQWSLYLKACAECKGINFFPKLIGHRFCALAVIDIIKNKSQLSKLIDVTKPDIS